MRRIGSAFALVIGGVACNAVYGLERTQLVDAARPDAMPTCEQPHTYARRIYQVFFQSCFAYATSRQAGRALASCAFPGRYAIAEGPIDQPLSPASVDPGVSETVTLLHPRLAPEGDRAIIQYGAPFQPPTFGVFHREADGWRRAYDLPLATDYDDTVGTPSRGPRARVFHAQPNKSQLDELVEDPPGTWTVRHTYDFRNLPTVSAYAPFQLSPDGLRVIAISNTFEMGPHAVLATRANIDEPFSFETVVLQGIPATALDPFMTEDCGRIYFSGLDSVFYAAQE